MMHLTEEQILGCCLETLSHEDVSQCQQHLQSCTRCRQHFQQMQKEIGEIAHLGGALPELAIPELPEPQASLRHWSPARLGAMVATLLLGIVLGYGAAGYTAVTGREVLPAPHPLAGMGAGAASSCPGVDLAVWTLVCFDSADSLHSEV